MMYDNLSAIRSMSAYCYFDVQKGTKLWPYTIGGEVRSSLVEANGAVYVGSGDKKLYAFHL